MKHSKHPRNDKKPHGKPHTKQRPHIEHKKHASPLIEGTLIILGRGGGVVKCLEYPEGIRVYENALNMGLHGDEVKVKLLTGGRTGEKGEKLGAITAIVMRAKTEFTGTLVMRDSNYFLKPADPKMYTDIFIPHDKLGDARPGDRVYGALTVWKSPHTIPEGKIIRRLGRPGEHETEMQAIALERGFEEGFPERVDAEARKIKERGIQKSDLAGRRDFRKVTTFTIDPFDAKDFDDAISVEELAGGAVEIGIHIADVSHYVTPKSALDVEALERGTSVYLVDRTIPMLPEALSNNLCSLMPRVDRLTVSAVVTFTADGKESDAWFGPGIIHSDHRFTYEDAQTVLDGAPHPLKKELMRAAEIARALGALRKEKGALTFDGEEVKIILGANGVPERIVKKTRTESHTLVEELMLLANRRVAEFLERGGTPTTPSRVRATPPQAGGENASKHTVIYRIHDQPSMEKSDDLAFFMRSIGHPVPVGKGGAIDPRSLSAILKKLDGQSIKSTVETFIIRSMAKAIYSTKNIGHYGLQFEEYTHFTSPIRRYPDLVIHRLLRYALAGKPAPANLRKTYERIARLCSMAEVRASDAERESIKFKLAEYMATRIGTETIGTITGVTEWGMYVRDKETTAEGLIGLRSMGAGPFKVDPRTATLTDEKTKRVFRIGDTIKVRIVRSDPERRQIDYELQE